MMKKAEILYAWRLGNVGLARAQNNHNQEEFVLSPNSNQPTGHNKTSLFGTQKTPSNLSYFNYFSFYLTLCGKTLSEF